MSKIENYLIDDEINFALWQKVSRDVELYPEGEILKSQVYIMADNGDLFKITMQIEKTIDFKYIK